MRPLAPVSVLDFWFRSQGGSPCFYRPQTKFAKVMFSQVSVCPQGGMHGRGGGLHGRGACMAGGVHGRGCSWQGVCMAGGACVAGAGCVWQEGMLGRGGMHHRGCAWQGACMAEGVHGRGCARQGGLCGRGRVCVAGGYAWQRGMCSGGMHGGGVCVPCPPDMWSICGRMHTTGMHSFYTLSLVYTDSSHLLPQLTPDDLLSVSMAAGPVFRILFQAMEVKHVS